jgi:hypothetical protein
MSPHPTPSPRPSPSTWTPGGWTATRWRLSATANSPAYVIARGTTPTGFPDPPVHVHATSWVFHLVGATHLSGRLLTTPSFADYVAPSTLGQPHQPPPTLEHLMDALTTSDVWNALVCPRCLTDSWRDLQRAESPLYDLGHPGVPPPWAIHQDPPVSRIQWRTGTAR